MYWTRHLPLMLLTVIGTLPPAARAADPAAAVEQAHGEIWRRFIDAHGVMLDFTDLDGTVNLPTPEECRAGKPNALGWFQPIENGAMFNGLYLDAAVHRWRATGEDADAAKARRLMEGLLLLNSISEVPGFVGRGVSTDGRSHFPMGSNDQTGPWIIGLWLYHQSGLATPAEAAKIKDHLVGTIGAIEALDWRMPAEPPFGTRGSFQGFHFEEASRLLFTLRMMGRLTGEPRWEALYNAERQRRDPETGLTKAEICGRGMKYFYAKTHNWTSCVAVAALRALWEIETDAALRALYADGLRASAALAAESLPLARQFDPADESPFSQDWRQAMMPLWMPQTTETEAVDLAQRQLREFIKISPRRQPECAHLREPVSAAWIITLCPDAEVVRPHLPEIHRVIGHYDYTRLYYSTFFWVESAWWRLKAAGLGE
jgi:hypothetical protein